MRLAVVVSRLDDIRPDILGPLIMESELEGWRHLRRLADEWSDGSNRFDRPGEGLFVAWSESSVVGVCGLSADPYADGPLIGRVRRLYVARSHRRCGVACQLVKAVVHAALDHFSLLRVRTENPAAARLYERLGFEPASGIPDCTHTFVLDSGKRMRTV